MNEPLVDYASTRQYYGALIAREYEQALGGSGAGLDPAVVSRAAPSPLELPINEAVTAIGWRLLGSEPMWAARALSILAWTLGGWMLFVLMRRLASPLAGVVAVGVWSLLPFAITASRSLQPDPLMVAAIVGAVLALVVYDDEPSRRHLIVAALAGAFALLAKLPAVFFIAPTFAALQWRRGGWSALWSRTTAVYAAAVLVPSVAYLAYGTWIDNFLQGQESGRIEPHLLLTVRFWKQWLYMVSHNIGIVAPIIGAAALLVAKGRSRWILGALFAGYVAFGLAFTVHYSTHEYYHLPLVAVLSVGVGLSVEWAVPFVRSRWTRLTPVWLGITAAVVVAASVRFGQYGFTPHPISNAARRSELTAPADIAVFLRNEAGVVTLAPQYGLSLRFHAGVTGGVWPGRNDEPPQDAGAVASTFAALRARHGARYFVITDMVEWHAQPLLRAYLDSRYVPLAAETDYIIYDLHEGGG
ncbi:MAG: hypothetical protein F2789_12260 [Actinobacteria bacterium]|nr:hypothetical protein [Actinomycetota bacterium]